MLLENIHNIKNSSVQNEQRNQLFPLFTSRKGVGGILLVGERPNYVSGFTVDIVVRHRDLRTRKII